MARAPAALPADQWLRGPSPRPTALASWQKSLRPAYLSRSLAAASGGLFFRPVLSAGKEVAGYCIKGCGDLFGRLPRGDTFYFESFGFANVIDG